MGNVARRFVGAAGIGLVGTATHFLLLVAAVRGFLLGPVAGSCIGALGGALVNYILNHRLNYRSSRPHREALPRYLAVAAGAFALNAALMFGFADTLRLNYLLAQAATSMIVLAWTFGMNHHWSFGA